MGDSGEKVEVTGAEKKNDKMMESHPEGTWGRSSSLEFGLLSKLRARPWVS